MTENKLLTQKNLLKIRAELSEELTKMTPSQSKEYLEAAKDVYRGLSKMTKIREVLEEYLISKMVLQSHPRT